MRVRLMFLVFIAFLVARSRPALAQDAGESDAAASDASAAIDAGCEDDSSCGVPEASPEASTIIACDGALCDTLQGRPSCDIAAGAAASGSLDFAWAAGAVAVLGAVVLRRRKHGASRPGRGGGAC